MIPEVIIFIGIQATGKSTFYHSRFSSSHIRINMDMLKTRHREKILTMACIQAKQSFVVDNTNPTVLDRQRYLEPALHAGFKPVAYYFESKLNDALLRNAARNESFRIPDVGLRGTAVKLERPSMEEGFQEIFYVSILEDSSFNVEPWRNEI